MNVNITNKIKSVIVAEGFTMKDLLALLAEDYGWSDSLSNFSRKLHSGTIQYAEVLEIAEALGYEIVWRKR